MDKIFILKLCIAINILFLFIFIMSFFVLNSNTSEYFRCGWSNTFIFVSITINTPLKYFCLCLFIIVFNMSEIFLNELASPIIQFSTYNPYKTNIIDFSKFELEVYSNLIFFIQSSKKLVLVLTTLSQIDIAFISLLSCQLSGFIAIRYLLDNKSFEKKGFNVFHNNLHCYESINDKQYSSNTNNTINI